MTHPTEADANPGALDGERLLTSDEVAVLYRVSPRTAARWAAAGKLGGLRTPGGQLRFRESAVRQAIGLSQTAPPPVNAAASFPAP